MIQKSKQTLSAQILKKTYIFIFFLYFAWIGAWFLQNALITNTTILESDTSSTLYWMTMKGFLWILPAIILLKYFYKSFWKIVALKRWRSILLWGGGVGLILGFLSIIPKWLSDGPLLSLDLSLVFLNAVIIAPLVEEIVFRGLVLSSLKEKYSFAKANVITALLFLGIHLPGWHFQGKLWDNLINPMGGAFSIFLIGLILGYVAHKSKSMAGSSLAHMINNFFSF